MPERNAKTCGCAATPPHFVRIFTFVASLTEALQNRMRQISFDKIGDVLRAAEIQADATTVNIGPAWCRKNCVYSSTGKLQTSISKGVIFGWRARPPQVDAEAVLPATSIVEGGGNALSSATAGPSGASLLGANGAPTLAFAPSSRPRFAVAEAEAEGSDESVVEGGGIALSSATAGPSGASLLGGAPTLAFAPRSLAGFAVAEAEAEGRDESGLAERLRSYFETLSPDAKAEDLFTEWQVAEAAPTGWDGAAWEELGGEWNAWRLALHPSEQLQQAAKDTGQEAKLNALSRMATEFVRQHLAAARCLQLYSKQEPELASEAGAMMEVRQESEAAVAAATAAMQKCRDADTQYEQAISDAKLAQYNAKKAGKTSKASGEASSATEGGEVVDPPGDIGEEGADEEAHSASESGEAEAAVSGAKAAGKAGTKEKAAREKLVKEFNKHEGSWWRAYERGVVARTAQQFGAEQAKDAQWAHRLQIDVVSSHPLQIEATEDGGMLVREMLALLCSMAPKGGCGRGELMQLKRKDALISLLSHGLISSLFSITPSGGCQWMASAGMLAALQYLPAKLLHRTTAVSKAADNIPLVYRCIAQLRPHASPVTQQVKKAPWTSC